MELAANAALETTARVPIAYSMWAAITSTAEACISDPTMPREAHLPWIQ